MRRLFFLLPDVDSCKAVVAELRQVGVPDRHLHVVASIEQTLEGLPQAGVLQTTEVVHGLEWGILIGGAGGLMGGLLALAVPPPGLDLGHSAVVASTAVGAVFGAIVSALMSTHEHNHKLNSFERAIEQGELVLMVDVPRKQVDSTKALILKHHPEAEIGVAKPGR
jgi:hypothetical protein